MANEMTHGVSLIFAKGGSTVDEAFGSIVSDVSGNSVTHLVQTVGFAADEALVMGDVSTPGMIMIRNLDSANAVHIRQADDAANCIVVKAGDVQLFRFSETTTAPFVIAITAAVQIEYWLFED
jgi:hypothetical protein